MHVHDRGIARAPQHEIDDRRIVDHRRGVGLAHDGGDAADRGRLARRGERLAVLGAWFADEGAHVDEPGRHHAAAAVDDLGAFRDARGMDAALGLADHAVGDQHVAFAVEVARRIDHATVGEQDGTAVGEHLLPSSLAGAHRQANSE